MDFIIGDFIQATLFYFIAYTLLIVIVATDKYITKENNRTFLIAILLCTIHLIVDYTGTWASCDVSRASIRAFLAIIGYSILAYLVDKKGTGVTRAELASIIWENELYDYSKQKQLDVYIQSLKKTLKAYNILSILEIDKGELRVNPSSFQCDFYDYLNGNKKAARAFCDNYMHSYSWAEATNAYITLKTSRK